MFTISAIVILHVSVYIIIAKNKEIKSSPHACPRLNACIFFSRSGHRFVVYNKIKWNLYTEQGHWNLLYVCVCVGGGGGRAYLSYRTLAPIKIFPVSTYIL